MSRFIDVYSGNFRALVKNGKHSDDELKEMAEKLIYEYVSIVSGTQVEAEMNKHKEIINHTRKIRCMEMCEGYMSLGEWETICDVLSNLGYNLNPDEKDKIKQRIQSIKSTSKYNLDRIKLSFSSKESKPVDPDYFVSECVMVETHFKMQIDFNKTPAKKYAYYVKRMCDEIRSANDAVRKKMKK